MTDIASALGGLAGSLFKAGAPTLGGVIGTAVGGPAGAVVGGLAGKVIDVLAGRLGTPATPDAVAEAVAQRPEVAQEVEGQAPALIAVWQAEAARADAAQAAEIEKGFGAWQFWRGAWQALVVGGSAVILLTALFGGGLVKPLIPMSEVIGWWGSITMTWLAVFNGGHTLKEIAPMLKFGRR
jgi:hypothetical protein